MRRNERKKEISAHECSGVVKFKVQDEILTTRAIVTLREELVITS
jgi:hypothetical protein